jgi:hypothetical protein
MNQPISQGFRITFVVHAIEGLFTGIVLLLFPAVFGDLFNWDMSDPAYRVVGAAVLGCALSSWLASRAEAWRDVKIVVQAKVVWMIIGAVVLLAAAAAGIVPAFAWLFVVVFAAFAAAFGYWLLVHSRTEAVQPA